METVLAKGLNFVFAKEFIHQEYGLDLWETLLAELPDDISTIWQHATIHQAYPFTSFKSGVFKLAEIQGSPETIQTAQMYMFIADRSLNTMYKTFFRLTSPSFVIKNYPRLWDRFFTAGTVEVPMSKKNQAHIKFILPEVFLDWLTPACLGYSRKAVEMAGGQFFTMRQLDKKQIQNDLWEILYELGWQ